MAKRTIGLVLTACLVLAACLPVLPPGLFVRAVEVGEAEAETPAEAAAPAEAKAPAKVSAEAEAAAETKAPAKVSAEAAASAEAKAPAEASAEAEAAAETKAAAALTGLRQLPAGTTQTAVALEWDTAEAALYRVYRYDRSAADWTLLDTCGEATYTDTGLSAGATLFYKIESGAQSSAVLTAYTAPAAPGQLVCERTRDGARLTWTAAENADGYTVQTVLDGTTKAVASVTGTVCVLSGDKLGNGIFTVTAYRYVEGVACSGGSTQTALPAAEPERETLPHVLRAGLGETVDLSVFATGEAVYETANAAGVSVSETGLASCLAIGETAVRIKQTDRETTLRIEVGKAPTVASFENTTLTPGVGEIYQLSLSLGAGEVSYLRGYTSSDTTVVSVDEDGILTALRVGTAVVTAETYNHVEAAVTVTVGTTPTQAVFETTAVKLGVGETFYNPVRVNEGAGAASFRYRGGADIVRVLPDGGIYALREGTARLTAAAYTGRYAVCNLLVVAAPAQAELDRDSLTLGLGETHTLRLQTDTGAGHTAPAWESADSAVVRVEKGELTPVAVGRTTVTVRTYNGLTAACTVTICAAPTRVTLNYNSLTCWQGEHVSLQAAVDEGAALGTPVWSSSNPSVVSVDADGLCVMNAPGTATVTATAYNGVAGSCVFTVRPAPTQALLDHSHITLGIGERFRLTASSDNGEGLHKLYWSSSAPAVMTIEPDGTVCAKSAGYAIAYMQLYNGLTAACEVTVKEAPTAVILSQTEALLVPGGGLRLQAAVNEGAAASSIHFFSNNNAVVQTDAAGNITAVGEGSAYIYAQVYNGVSAACLVTVSALPTALYFETSSYSLSIGTRFTIPVYDQNGVPCSRCTFTSSDPSVVTVSTDGLAHLRKMGSAVITAASANGVSVSCTIWVTRMEVPYVSQLPYYPTGCEAASCAMLMQYYGYPISVGGMVDFIPNQLLYTYNGVTYGPDINYTFVGTPTGTYLSGTPGYGIFSPGVANSLNSAISYYGGGHTAYTITGCSFSELLDYVSHGYPVIVWSTYNMNYPTTVNAWYILNADGSSRYFSYPRGTHVCVLVGFSDYSVTLADPYDNWFVSYDIDTFESRWYLLGNQGVVME